MLEYKNFIQKSYVFCVTKMTNVWRRRRYTIHGRIQEVADQGDSESLILTPWPQSWRMVPSLPPPTINVAPLKFSYLEPQGPTGCPCLCLNGALFVMLIYLFLSFFLSFPLFPLFFFPFPFLLFLAPLQWPGGPKPPRICPCN